MYVIPPSRTGVLTGVQALEAGYYHTCALVAGGGAKCWGSNSAGQLGAANASLTSKGLASTAVTSVTPVDVTSLASGVVTITAGANHSCALQGDGVLTCWGANGSGQLGVSGTGGSAPATVEGLSLPVVFTGSASSSSGSSATLNGQVIAKAPTATYFFQYGQTFGYGSSSGQGSASGSGVTGVLVALNNLQHGPYHYRTVAQNGAGVVLGLNHWIPAVNAPTNVVFGAFASSTVGSTVTLRWTTTEVDVIGFRLYRSDKENDGFQSIRASLIPAQLSTGGGSYTYFDLNVPDGRWYYRIEAVSGTGDVAASAGPTWVMVDAATAYRLFLPLVTNSAEDLR